ncbi:unnamed protein product [Clonostachys byssicola]|uniref:Heterokaryon incompatibility domain-containing protein n=1 Tax=Clonostachys byssicola TaxID=160290 RepID=A0A9N9UD84_9HYPO|nr:unnamed protein product [Clonostachys byssicola]
MRLPQHKHYPGFFRQIKNCESPSHFPHFASSLFSLSLTEFNMPLYEPLPDDSVRLLRLLPLSDGHKGIDCQLFTCPLLKSGSTHPYEALSYVWGPEDNQHSIRINNCEVSVRNNLYEALSCLQDPFIERIIWIDAICINQEDINEKGQQVQCMAKIYSRASRVIVWLGEVADQSNEALEAIRAAAEEQSMNSTAIEEQLMDSTAIEEQSVSSAAVEEQSVSSAAVEEQSVNSATDEAILALLDRPWFTRIWVLQEVAAARHILIKSGRTEIDGFAFCSGLTALKISYGTNQSLRDIIRTTAYLIRGAVFRPRYEGRETSQLGRFALNIRPLSQLVDTYHTRQATDRRDKIYALLGMSSDSSGDLNNAGLSPNYQTPWKEVFRNLVKFSTSDQMSVTVWDDKEVAVIKGKGCFLGHVSEVKSHHTRDDIQIVTFLWQRPFYQEGNQNSRLTFPASAKPIQEGDAVYCLQGALMPSIMRLCGGYLAVIAMAIPLPEYTRPITTFRHELPVVWDWEASPGKAQDGAYDEGLIASPKKPKCPSTECKCQDYLHESSELWDLGLILNGLERYEEAGNTFQKAVKFYGTALETAKASHGHWTNSNNEALSVMDDLINEEQGADTALKVKEKRMPLSQAAASGNESFVRLLLDTGSDVDVKDDDGRTPLFHAVDNKREAMIQLLLDRGATIETGDESGTTPLSQAAVKGHAAIIRLLLDRGADIDACDTEWGRTPLSQAAVNGHKDIARLLLDEGADIVAMDYRHRTPLYHAVLNGHKDLVRLLLDEGADIDARNNAGMTPLSRAAANGHEDLVRLLLDRGANIDAGDNYGGDPLSSAAGKGHTAIVQLLIDKGADIEAGSPLLQAAKKGHTATVQFLIEKGATVDHKPLWWAVQNGHEAVVRLLLDKGADIEAGSPLAHAARQGHTAIVQLLIDKGADIDAESPLAHAARQGHTAIVQLLIDKGADIDAESPLSHAARQGHTAIVQLLIKKGATIDPKSLWEAAKKGHEDVVQLLRDNGAKD